MQTCSNWNHEYSSLQLLKQQICLVSMKKVAQLFGSAIHVLSLACSWVCCSNKALKQSDSFFFSSKACMPFLSPRKLISHPDTQTWPFHPLFSDFFFLAWGRKRTQEVLCYAAVGVETPHPSQRLNLMLGDETGNRCHPWPSVLKHYRPHNQGRSEGGGAALLTSYFTISPLIIFLLTDKYWVTPHSHVCHQRLFPSESMSVQGCVFNINTAVLRFSCVHPNLTSTPKDDPSDKEGNTK